MGRQMIDFKELNPFDIMVVEALADPETRPWANDIIDIVTARKRREITELEADFLLWGIDETRAPNAVKDPETLALTRRLCAEARAQIRTVR
jgi:hypothetical protein